MKVTFVTLSTLILPWLMLSTVHAGLIGTILSNPVITVSFSRSASETSKLVAGYALFYQPTNSLDSGNWVYLGQCPVGYTNIYAFLSQIRGNPVYFCVDSLAWDGKESYHSDRFLFDTNWLNKATAKTLSTSAVSTKATAQTEIVADDSGVTVQSSTLATPTLENIHPLATGSVLLTGTGSAEGGYTVLACTNLTSAQWSPIGIASANDTNLVFIDMDAPNYSERYYRFSK